MGLTNVTTCRLDLERIDQPDDSYDVVLCREGLMFAPDPSLAAREICRILRPGGTTALAVWGPRKRNPWLSIVFDEVSAQLGTPVPPPGVPGPFSLDEAENLLRILSDAGLVDVVVGELPVPVQADSFDQWWARTVGAGRPAGKHAGVPTGTRHADPSGPTDRGDESLRNTRWARAPRDQPDCIRTLSVTTNGGILTS